MRHEGKEEDSIFWWRVTSNGRVMFKILGMSGEGPILISRKKHPEECAWSDYCNNFEKSVRDSLFSFIATNLHHVSLEMEKR